MRTFKFFAFTLMLALMLVTAASAENPIVHRVSVGGPDACGGLGFPHPGCDANFSLSAKQDADGSVSGQYNDRFSQANGGGGFHAVIDCVSVVGNTAWVSGVITHGNFNGLDLTGLPVAARVQDNGTSANDPADEISVSNVGDSRPCTDHVLYTLISAPEGQVKVSSQSVVH
jgi:hypothetical protein